MTLRPAISLVIASSLAICATIPFVPALPGYRYSFPRDYFNHPDYRTEWWYYTGNLHTAEGRKFGFELTFFRQGVDRETQSENIWRAQDVWLAHLALSDIGGQSFYHQERLNRSGPGLAGADEGQSRIWNGNWKLTWSFDAHASGGVQSERLEAVAGSFSFDLIATPRKPPVIHGVAGISQKSEGAGQASHYFSQTRMATRGTIVADGKTFAVEGWSWMDHEFFTHAMAANQSGWDWFSLQFDDGSELMLYRLRRKDGTADSFSAGTYIDAQSHVTHLFAGDFELTPGAAWSSPQTRAKYPIGWTIRIPVLAAMISAGTRLPPQEFTGDSKIAPVYWEGAIEASGVKQGQAVSGAGYLEMTGYAGIVRFGE